MTINLCGFTGGRQLRAHVTRYVCPYCVNGRWESGERCLHCAGFGVTDDVEELPGDPDNPVRLPRPPAVMKAPCVDCAYRPGSPEDGELSPRPDNAGVPFFCHHGMHRQDGPDGDVGYVPAAECNGMPLGYMVCAGWWNHVAEGGERPERPFRDPGGSDRRGTA